MSEQSDEIRDLKKASIAHKCRLKKGILRVIIMMIQKCEVHRDRTKEG